jgi:hypothetical protein
MAATISQEKEGDFAVHISVYGRVQTKLTPIPDVQERTKRNLLSCLSRAV